MTSIDIFKDIKSTDGMSHLYHQIVDDIEADIKLKYPLMYSSIIKTNESYADPNHLGGFDLLHGLTQSGKSPALITSMWLQNFKYFNRTAFLTKCLGSIRTDFMMKMKNGFLNDMIETNCIKHGCTHLQSEYFKLKPFDFSRKGQLSQCTWRSVPILLLNKANYKALSSFYRQVANEPKTSMIFIIDEVHQMYADLNSFVDNNGLLRGKTSTRHIMHWIINKAKKQRCHILGVTATPYRSMASDPICYPRSVINFIADPPFQGAVYYGYNRQTAMIQNIKLKTYDPSQLMTKIKDIMNLSRHLVNGSLEVPFICITTTRECADHDHIYDQIMVEFGDLVHCKTFNCETKNSNNILTLNEFFDPQYLTSRVCQSGAFILIGKGRLDTGVTVKPELKRSCKASHNNQSYEICGITDQIMGHVTDSSHVQSLIQLMRLTGWFPLNHASRLHVPDQEHIKLFQTSLIAIDNQFAKQYKGEIGPESVNQISTHSKLVKRICGSSQEDTHRVSERFGYDANQVATQPIGSTFIEIETIIHSVQIRPHIMKAIIDCLHKGKHPNLSSIPLLSQLQGNAAAQVLLRHEYYEPLKKNNASLKGVFGCYDESRANSIMQASIDPKSTDTQWQVNGFTWGPKGFNTPLDHIYLVLFKDDWKTREVNGQTYQNLANAEKTFFFHRGGNDYLTIDRSKQFEHKYLDKFTTFNITPQSNQHILACGADIDSLADQFKNATGKPNPWGLFMSLCKMFGKSGSSSACSLPYKTLKNNQQIYPLFKAILIEDISREEMIQKGYQLLQPHKSLIFI